MIVQDRLRRAAASIGRHGLQSYSTYRKVGLSWLNEIPEHWKLPRLGFITELNPTKQEVRGEPDDKVVSFVPMESVGEWGGLDLSSERAIAEVVDGYTYFANDDVLVAKITPCFENGKGALATGLKSGLGFGTTELHVLRPTDAIDAAFLFYLSVSHHFRSLGEASMYGAAGQKRVPEVYVFGFRHPLPPLAEQRAIARFLNEATRRIDKLIANKERLIELLEEKRTALTTRAVTKGLDPDVPMKDSGVEWLGEIPEHWNTPNLNLLLSEPLSYGVLKPDRYDGEEAVPLIRITDIEDGQIDAEGAVRISPQQHRQYLRTSLEADDVVVSVVGTIGESFVVPPTMRGANLSRALARISLREEVRPQFLHYFIQSDFFVQRCAMIPQGTAQRVLNLGDLGKFPVPLPPIEEQKAIVADLAERLETLASAMNALTSAVDTLQEYRSALITAAVTGKIDVRDHAA